MSDTEISVLSKDSFPETMDILASCLEKQHLKPEEIRNAQLLMEETFHRLKKGMNGGDDFSLHVSLRKMWGDTELRLTVKGPEFNPIPAVTDQLEKDVDAASEDDYRFAILRAYSDRMRHVYKNSINLVIIRVHSMDSTKKQLIFTVSGMALGVLCGILMQNTLDAATLDFINTEIITPTRDIFLNAIHMLMAPVTFFAVIAGITNISDTALIGKLGGRMIIVSLFMQIFAILISLGPGTLLFKSDLSGMQAGIVASENATEPVQYDSLTDMVFDIVPQNLVEPFQGDKILQVIFLAIFFGFILNKMGDKAKSVNECIDFIFRVFMTALKAIVKTLPFVVFLSMTTLFSNTGLDSLLAFSSLFIGLILGVIMVWGVGALAVVVFSRISPVPMTKKTIALSPLIFSVSSSHARLPFVLKFCHEKLGIDARLASFSIPVGVQLNKAGISVYLSLVVLMMMRVYDITMTPGLFVTLVISVYLMSIAKPPVPCGGMICLSFLFGVVGVPADAVSVILCVEPVAAMFNGVCNESTNITTTLILAQNNDMLDKDVYYSA